MRKYVLSAICMLLLAVGYGQRAKDSVAIRLLLEKESATWRSGDVKAHAACWYIRPYSRILLSLGNGEVLDIPPAMMINPSPDMIGEGGHSVNTNYKMSISGTNAWVSHHEESVDKNGVHTHSDEIRILEKIKGQWKLVGQSIHIIGNK